MPAFLLGLLAWANIARADFTGPYNRQNWSYIATGVNYVSIGMNQTNLSLGAGSVFGADLFFD